MYLRRFREKIVFKSEKFSRLTRLITSASNEARDDGDVENEQSGACQRRDEQDESGNAPASDRHSVVVVGRFDAMPLMELVVGPR